MYIPQSMWSEVKDKMLNIHKKIKVGSPFDKDTFVSAVIDDKVYIDTGIEKQIKIKQTKFW